MSSPEIKLRVQIRIPNFEIRISLLSLSLFVLRVFANDTHDALPSDDLAIVTQSLYRCSYLHGLRSSILLVSVRDSTLREIIGRNLDGHSIANQYLNEIHPHLSGDVSKNLMAILKLHFKRCIGQSFRNHSIDFDWLLFCHVKELLTTRSRSLLCPSSQQWCVRSVPKACHLMS